VFLRTNRVIYLARWKIKEQGLKLRNVVLIPYHEYAADLPLSDLLLFSD